MSAIDDDDPRRLLSPVRVEPRPVELPYGLSWGELRSCLPELAGAQDLQAYASHAIQGLHGTGNSSILTLAYAATGEMPREVIIFVKQINDARQAESTKHSFLKTQGMPLANLLQAFPRSDGEVLVLEFLPTIGTGPDEADDLLALIAQLNAVADPPSDLFRPAPGSPQEEFERHVHDALIAVAPDVDPVQWLEIYRRVGREVATLPVALNHGELHFQQVGWSRHDGAREVVMFDLATMALLPALTDVAGMLRPLSVQTGRDEHELFASYLGSLNRRTAAPIDEHEAWHDLCLTRIVRSFESLPWVVAMNDHPDIAENGVDGMELLQRDLDEVGAL